jgi:hypothetical protein
VILCNVAGLPETIAANLQNFVRQGGGLLIFGGDKLQPDSYNQRLSRSVPAELREKKTAPEAKAEKIEKLDLTHPALQSFADPILLESLKSVRVWGYIRADPRGKSALISLANGDPLVLEQSVGAGKVILIATTADRDWTDLPLKTAFLPLLHSFAQHLAGGKRGHLDTGIAVGDSKELFLPPSLVGKSIRVTKPTKQAVEVPIIGEKSRAMATVEDHDVAGVYRVSLPAGTDKDSGVPQLYAVNPPFLESRLEEIGTRELQTKLAPVRAEVIPIDALKEGGKRTDLALPLLALLFVTLLLEGWLGQRF